MIKFLQWFEQKNANIFAKFFGENICKIITSGPGTKPLGRDPFNGALHRKILQRLFTYLAFNQGPFSCPGR
jgi:hypothetical protein